MSKDIEFTPDPQGPKKFRREIAKTLKKKKLKDSEEVARSLEKEVKKFVKDLGKM